MLTAYLGDQLLVLRSALLELLLQLRDAARLLLRPAECPLLLERLHQLGPHRAQRCLPLCGRFLQQPRLHPHHRTPINQAVQAKAKLTQIGTPSMN
jgi:hypothetical protein